MLGRVVHTRARASSSGRRHRDERVGGRGEKRRARARAIVAPQDRDGDENHHLWAIDATAAAAADAAAEGRAAARDLTPFDGVKAQNLMTNKRFPDQLLVALNRRADTRGAFDRCSSLLRGDLLTAR